MGKGTSAAPPVCGTLSRRPRTRIRHPRCWNRKGWTQIRLLRTSLSSAPRGWPPTPRRTCPQAPPPLPRPIRPELKRAKESEAPRTERVTAPTAKCGLASTFPEHSCLRSQASRPGPMAAHHAFLKDESDARRQWVITPLYPKRDRTDLAQLPAEARGGILGGDSCVHQNAGAS